MYLIKRTTLEKKSNYIMSSYLYANLLMDCFNSVNGTSALIEELPAIGFKVTESKILHASVLNDKNKVSNFFYMEFETFGIEIMCNVIDGTIKNLRIELSDEYGDFHDVKISDITELHLKIKLENKLGL